MLGTGRNPARRSIPHSPIGAPFVRSSRHGFGPDRRFRRPIHPADREARARGERLFRDRALHCGGEGGGGAESRKRSSCRAGRRACSSEGSPQVPEAIFAAGVPVLGICYGQQGMVKMLGGVVQHLERARIWLGADRYRGRVAAVRGRGRARRHRSRVDEPRRPRGGAAGGVRAHRHHAQRAVRGHRGREAAALRRPVPSRGGAHAQRRGDAPELRAQDRGLRQQLDDGRLPRGRDRRGCASRSARRR